MTPVNAELAAGFFLLGVVATAIVYGIGVVVSVVLDRLLDRAEARRG